MRPVGDGTAFMHGAERRKRKLLVRAVLVSGAGAGVIVAGIVTSCWDELVVRHHLWKLHQDATLVATGIDEPEGTHRHRAMELFARTSSGRAVLAAEFERMALRHVLDRRLRRSLLRGAIWLGDGYVAHLQWGGDFMGRYGTLVQPVPTEHLAVLQAILTFLAGETFHLDGYENLIFSIRSSSNALRESPRAFVREFGHRAPKNKMVCLVRAAPDTSVPILIGLLGASFTTARLDAANALARLGPIAREAIPALEKELADPGRQLAPEVAHTFRATIERLRGQ